MKAIERGLNVTRFKLATRTIAVTWRILQYHVISYYPTMVSVIGTLYLLWHSKEGIIALFIWNIAAANDYHFSSLHDGNRIFNDICHRRKFASDL